MGSYEKEVKDLIKENKPLPSKLDITLVEYFWQANPFFASKKDSIPRFLRKVEVLKNFTDNELRIFSRYMHLRTFADGERVFQQNDLGVGFYFIFGGRIDIVVGESVEKGEEHERHIVSLDRGDYFGEMALLQEQSVRNASAVSVETTQLIGLFKPDLENMMADYPLIATKLLQAISVIIATRLFSLTKEVRRLKHKIKVLKNERDENKRKNEKA